MNGPKYFATTLENQKSLTVARLKDFLSSSTSKVIFMNEPVGYGKTTTLMDLCLTPTENGQFRRSVFLTYSNWKAEELEGEFIQRIGQMTMKPRILRVFGEKHIKDERRYRKEGDIDFCHYPNERSRKIENGEAPIIICKSICKQKEVCPYYRTVTEARENVFDILIGNLNEMQTSAFYTDSKFKFSDVDLFILDEDAIKKSKFDFSISVEQIVPFVDFLPQFPEYVDQDEDLNDFTSDQKTLIKNRFQKIQRFFVDESGLCGSDDKVDPIKLERRGFNTKKISPTKSRKSFKSMPEKSKERRLRIWYKRLLEAVLTDSSVELQLDRESGRAVVWCFPNIKDFKKVFSEIGLTGDSKSKVIITDATSDLREVVARLRIESAEELDLSYHPQKDGFLIPKGQIFQVVDNVSKTKLFDSDTKDLKLNELKNLMLATKAMCNELQFSDETWIIPFQSLAKNPLFHNACVELGFKSDVDLYHGAVRGLNAIQDKDLVILGANFPQDQELRKQQLIELGTEVSIEHSNDFLQWKLDSQGNHVGLNIFNARQVGVDGWMNFVREKGFGNLSRKVYLESVIQSMRSRFFWNNTKTLIFSSYPLTDFGIAVHRLITRNQFRDRFFKKVS